MNHKYLKSGITRKALELGFDACGFAKVQFLDTEARRLEQWLKEKRHGTMHWMENHFDKRVDPAKLVPGAKSVISVIASYHFSENLQFDNKNVPKIAKFARGRDYHKVFKKRLKQLFSFIQDSAGDIDGRIFVDSAPVLDKTWAEKSGLGWIGKNSNLLNKRLGSFFLIGELICDLDFEYDKPVSDHCGSCTKCIDACPTDAIYEPWRVDSNRCISYLTIELKESIDKMYHANMKDWVFGCDICQDVCPWNNSALNGHISDLKPRKIALTGSIDNWLKLDREEFNKAFEGSPVRRAGYDHFIESAKIVAKNIGNC